jgi:hypothetical protein
MCSRTSGSSCVVITPFPCSEALAAAQTLPVLLDRSSMGTNEGRVHWKMGFPVLCHLNPAPLRVTLTTGRTTVVKDRQKIR